METPRNLGIFSKNFNDLEDLRKNWGWFLTLGILLTFLGVLAIAASTATTIVSVIFLGSLLVIGGIAQTIYAFWIRKWSGFSLSLLAGILYSVTGIFLIIHPIEAAISLTLLLAAFYIVGGLFRMITSVMTRFNLWGWALLSGTIKFILGMLIWQGWPETGLWVFGLFIGIDLIFFGWFWIVLALSARKNNI